MGVTEIEVFLTHLVIAGKVSSLDLEHGEEGAAIFYRQVLKIIEPWLTDIASAGQAFASGVDSGRGAGGVGADTG